MKRRQFMQLLAATGLTAQLPLLAPRAYAAAPERFLVVVNASGGWDPTSLCDPKGLNGAYANQSTRYEGSTNSVDLDPTKAFGDIRWSAVPEGVSNDAAVLTRINAQFDQFFTTYGNRMTVINGIDTGTNNHDTGNRIVWSGMEETGYPSLAAYFAAATSPTLPMAFISNGGYDFTDSLVARARASSAGFINEIADPNANGSSSFLYRTSDRNIDLYQQVMAAQQARLQRQQQHESLPLKRQQLSQLFGIRNTDSNLGGLSVALSNLQQNISRDDHWHAGRSNGLKSQAEVVVAAFQSGLAASANLNLGGFDTHGNHDASAYPQMGDLLEGVHYLQVALQFAGIADRTTIVMGSDFGRTPYYNSGNGKDHWPITSMIVLHPQATGGKVFGASDSAFRGLKLNRSTGLPDPQGTVLTPAHVNQALRKLLNVDQITLNSSYSLRVSNTEFAIFS